MEFGRHGSFTSRRVPKLALALSLVVSFCLAPVRAENGKSIFGWVERVLVGTSRLEMTAKLDTGAETSSLHATRIRRYRKSGKSWIQFTVAERTSGRRLVFRRPLARTVRIKEHDGSNQKRPVVEVEVCLGAHLRRVEVSLVDRSEFEHPVLLGRNFLAGGFVVDPELARTVEPECDAAGEGDP